MVLLSDLNGAIPVLEACSQDFSQLVTSWQSKTGLAATPNSQSLLPRIRIGLFSKPVLSCEMADV